jgi:hypothetical protein
MRRYAVRIQVRPVIRSAGAWDRHSLQVELDEAYLSRPDRPIAQVASTIVHELTHARIEAAGIRYSLRWRLRIETACVRQQLLFLRSLPSTPEHDTLVAQYHVALANIADHYNPAASHERDRRAARAIGMPLWLVSMASRVRALLRA